MKTTVFAKQWLIISLEHNFKGEKWTVGKKNLGRQIKTNYMSIPYVLIAVLLSVPLNIFSDYHPIRNPPTFFSKLFSDR